MSVSCILCAPFRSLGLALVLAGSVHAERLIGEGDTWRYYKGSSTPPSQSGVTWTQIGFNDTGSNPAYPPWGPPSPSGFGYGDGDDANGALSDMQNNYRSVFLRKSFTVADPTAVQRLTLAVDYDDGFVAYVNGVEVARRNMPEGPIDHDDFASTAHEASRGGGAENPQEKEFIEINPALLVSGNNLLAISGHNSSLGSTDFTLVPELYGNVTLVRGPFLQMPNAGQISLVWRTDALTDASVDYGSDTNYAAGTASDGTLLRQHAITLPVISPGTTVYYRVRSGGVILAESSFKTPRDATQPFRFAVYGDFGHGNLATAVADANTSAVAIRVNALDPDLTLTVGDNIYNNGQPGNHDPFWFKPYDAINRRAPLFPALGNHDVDNSSNGQHFIDSFHLPRNGPAAYLERSYSFDYGNAHFAVVDVNPFVYKIDTTAQAAIKSWLASDLAATTQRWKFVFFHQPAYTSTGSGVHNPETILQTELQPLFVQHGVQVVFQGHNHFYERINPINGVHYITSGGGGRSIHSPSTLAPYSAAVNGSVYSATEVDVAGGSLTLRQISAAGNQIDALQIDLDHPFKIDGLLDSTQWQRAGMSGTLRLHAAIRGNFLYVATQDAGEGSDHFIYLNNQSASLRAANWNKAGQVMTWSAFLADENETGFKGWFNASEQLLTDSTRYSATTSGLNNNGAPGNGVLEGTIDLAVHFGTFPAQIHLAAAPFVSPNGGALVNEAQVPAGNGNGNIEESEFLVLNTRAIALDLPISDAGADQSVEAGMQVLLSGSADSPSDLPLSYLWSQLSGPLVVLANNNQLAANFALENNVAQSTDLVFQFRVNDTRFDTDDTLKVELFPMTDGDNDGLSDQEELKGTDNQLTNANPGGQITDPTVADSDGDGAGDGSEARAGTNPNSAASVFRISGLVETGGSVEIAFESVAGRSYQLQVKAELGAVWMDLGDPVDAAGSVSSITAPVAGVRSFYRIKLL